MNFNQQIPIPAPSSQKPTPPPSREEKLKVWQIVLIVLGVLFILSAIGNILKDNDNKEENKTTEASSTSSAVSKTTSKSFDASEYDYMDYIVLYKNHSNYKNKNVTICGKIDSTGVNIANTTYITIKEGIDGFGNYIYCNIADSEADGVTSKYKSNEYIEIAGKVDNMVLGALNIDNCHIISSGETAKKKFDEYNKKIKEEEESKAKEESAENVKIAQKYKESCETFTYKEIARSPKKYEGKNAKFEGQVNQVIENGNDIILRVNVTKEENEFVDGGYLYSDTIYVEYTRKSEYEDRILEDDIITLYGKLNGTKTYSSTLSGNITIPYLLAEYIDIKN